MVRSALKVLKGVLRVYLSTSDRVSALQERRHARAQGKDSHLGILSPGGLLESLSEKHQEVSDVSRHFTRGTCVCVCGVNYSHFQHLQKSPHCIFSQSLGPQVV